MKLVHFDEPSFETTFEVDPNLSHFFELGQFVGLKEGAVIFSAVQPISAVMIKENLTYFGDVVSAQPLDGERVHFPFIANTGSDVPTETQISIFNPHEGPLNLTFASFDQFGQAIRKRTDDEPLTIWSLENKTLPTNSYLYNLSGQSFSQGSLNVYSELEGKGFFAVVEGVRRINDSRALLAGDAFFSYEGQPLYASALPTPTPTSAIIIPSQTGCVQSPAYTGDLCTGYRLITSLESDSVCYETLEQCLPNQGEGTCVQSPTHEGDICNGYRVMPGISRACYSLEQCRALLTPRPTKEPQKCQLNGDHNGDGVVNLVDFEDWIKDFLAGEAKLDCFEYWRRNMYAEPTVTPRPCETADDCPQEECGSCYCPVACVEGFCAYAPTLCVCGDGNCDELESAESCPEDCSSATPTPSPCENDSCDVNQDGQEDEDDYHFLMSCYGRFSDDCLRCDFNCDGAVNAHDIAWFTSYCSSLIPTVTPTPAESCLGHGEWSVSKEADCCGDLRLKPDLRNNDIWERFTCCYPNECAQDTVCVADGAEYPEWNVRCDEGKWKSF